MNGANRTGGKPRPDDNTSPMGSDRKPNSSVGHVSEVLFYFSMTILALILGAIFWSLLSGF